MTSPYQVRGYDPVGCARGGRVTLRGRTAPWRPRGREKRGLAAHPPRRATTAFVDHAAKRTPNDHIRHNGTLRRHGYIGSEMPRSQLCAYSLHGGIIRRPDVLLSY